MSNTEYNGSDTDDIIHILDKDRQVKEIIEGTKKAIQSEEQQHERLKPHLGWYNVDGRPMTIEEYQRMLQQQTAKKIRQKSIGKPPISTEEITIIDKTIEFIKEYKVAIAGLLAAAAIVAFTWGPTLKANGQINDLSNKISDKLTKMKLGEQQKGLFSKFNLTVSPSELIDKWELNSDSHMRIYILSTILNQSDFEKVLNTLGYKNQDSYVKELGFKHNERRAIENYHTEYEEKLKDIVMHLNKNPQEVDEYLKKYPELGLILDPSNTFILQNGDYGSTRENGGRK